MPVRADGFAPDVPQESGRTTEKMRSSSCGVAVTGRQEVAPDLIQFDAAQEIANLVGEFGWRPFRWSIRMWVGASHFLEE